MIQACPQPDRVKAFAFGTLKPDQVGAVSEHLDTCESCRLRYETLVGQSDPIVAGLRAGAAPCDDDPRVKALAARVRNIPFEESPSPPPTRDPINVETSAIAEKTSDFDPLHVWLGIPPEEQPPDHYRLLGIKRLETNLDVIESAADRQMAHLRTFQSGQRGKFTQSVLNQVSAARICLLNPKKKAAYDQQLKQTAHTDEIPPSKIDLPADPPRTLDEFGHVVVSLGLISANKLEKCLAKLPPHERPTDAETLARQLVADGLLAKHQAACIYQGKWQKLVLGEYTLLARIGGGGMGDVYKAWHRRMGVVRAIKVIKRELVDSPDAARRFHREVVAAAQLSHPHIVMAHDASQDQGRHYLVMEYVAGPDLSGLVKQRGPLPVHLAIDFIIQAARGMAYAHSKGTIHRDIKPGNLLLDSDGSVKVSDLGLARLDPEKSAVDEEAHLTTSEGKIMGTVDFMAPEQAEDTHSADHRADIYSMGCTLYRLLTGKSPYGKGATIQRMMAHRTAPIPKIRDELPRVPQRVDDVFARMVAKRPEDRPQSMEEVIGLLEACASTADVPISAKPPAPCSAAPERPPGAETLEESPAEPEPVINLESLTRWPLSGTQKLKQRAQTLLRSQAGVPIIAGGVALLLTVLGISVAAVVMTLRTSYGDFVVEVDGDIAPDVQVLAKAEGAELEIASEKNGWKLRLEKGEYRLEVRGGGDRFEVDKDVVTITRNGRAIVRLTRKHAPPPRVDAPPAVPASPNELNELAVVRRLVGAEGPTRKLAVSSDGRLAASVSGYPFNWPTRRSDCGTCKPASRSGRGNSIPHCLRWRFHPMGGWLLPRGCSARK